MEGVAHPFPPIGDDIVTPSYLLYLLVKENTLTIANL